MDSVVFQVSEFVAVFNQTLETAYPRVIVEGEISGFSISQNKWVRFKLKDSSATIDCFSTVWQIKTPLEDGMVIRVEGRPKLSDHYGFSFSVDSAVPTGEGALLRAYVLLKQKLEAEGLFDESRKRNIPFAPKKIGVVTSRDAAAWSDFKRVINERWSGVEVELISTLVQGENAASAIVSAIEQFQAQKTMPDVLVVTRGGGSIEDLSAFNDESVVRAVASSRIPTVVGIGHERDITLAELSADVRASTPSVAAKLVVPDKIDMLRSLDSVSENLTLQMYGLLNKNIAKLESTNEQMFRFTRRFEAQIVQLEQTLQAKTSSVYDKFVNKLQYIDRRLKDLNPQEVLKRGYAIATVNNQVIHKSTDVSVGDTLMVQLQKGQVKTEVKDV